MFVKKSNIKFTTNVIVSTYNLWYNLQVLQLLMLQPSVVYTETKPPSLKALITDPYIILAAGKKNDPLTNIKYN